MDAATIARILLPFYGELAPARVARDCAEHAAILLDSSARSREEDGTVLDLLRHAIERARTSRLWPNSGTSAPPTFTGAQAADVAARAYAALGAAGYDDVSGPSVRQSGKRLARPKGASEPPEGPRGTPKRG